MMPEQRNALEIQAIVEGVNEVSGLPTSAVLEYVAKNTLGYFYVLHRPREWYFDHSEFRLHIGKMHNLREAEITGVDRLRDGGTLHIWYISPEELGVRRLYVPSLLKRGKAFDQHNMFRDETKQYLEILLQHTKFSEVVENYKKRC